MMRTLSAMSVCTAFFCTPVAADVFADCAQAVAAGDRQAAKKAADILLVGAGTLVPPEHIEIAGECVKMGRDRPYAYSKLRQRYRPVAKAKADNDVYASQEAQREYAIEARRKQLQDSARREKLRNESLENAKARRAAAAHRKTVREREVLQRLAVACSHLYKTDPDITITNKLCFDVFFTTGLPD